MQSSCFLQQGSEGNEGQICARERRGGLTPLFFFYIKDIDFFSLWLYNTEHMLMLLQYRYR